MKKSGQNIAPSTIDPFVVVIGLFLCFNLKNDGSNSASLHVCNKFRQKWSTAKSNIWINKSKKIEGLVLFSLNLGSPFTEIGFNSEKNPKRLFQKITNVSSNYRSFPMRVLKEILMGPRNLFDLDDLDDSNYRISNSMSCTVYYITITQNSLTCEKVNVPSVNEY